MGTVPSDLFCIFRWKNMKNQYVADIGDYGKYSLLKAFEDAGIRIGINWYLTEDDGSGDGRFVKYLEDDTYREYCSDVYDELKVILSSGRRDVNSVEKSGIFRDVIYYGDNIDSVGKLGEHLVFRTSWHESAMSALEGAELVFLDPDNGLITSDKMRNRNHIKYVTADEVIDYFIREQNVVYYCHKGRRTKEQWEEYKSTVFRKVPNTRPMILTFHKGTQRSYIFVIHPEDYERYREIAGAFSKKWSGIFAFE